MNVIDKVVKKNIRIEKGQSLVTVIHKKTLDTGYREWWGFGTHEQR